MASKRGTLKLVAFVLGLVFLLYLVRAAGLQHRLSDVLQWIQGLGPWGPVAFVSLYVVACVLFLPGSILTMSGGFLFGMWLGLGYVWLAATTGATVTFLLGRYVARSWVAKKVEQNERFSAIDSAIGREGWKIVALLRLSPLVPFNLLNYSMGLTCVTFREYFFATCFGMLPSTAFYVYLGSLAGDLAALSNRSGRTRSPLEWTLYGIGLVATLVVTVYITRVAKKALSQKLQA